MAILLVVLIPAVMAVLAGGVVLVLVAAFGRAEADSEGRRGEGVYLGAVAFVSVYLVLFASFGVVASLASLLGHQSNSISASSSSSSASALSSSSALGTSTPLTSLATLASGQLVFNQPSSQNGIFVAVGSPSRRDEATTGALASGFVGLAGLGVLAYHRRRLRDALAERGSGALARVMTTYRRLVSFVSVFVAALAAAVALFGVYRLIAPGMSGSSGRSGGAEELVDAGYLALASGWLVKLHRLSDPETGLTGEAT